MFFVYFYFSYCMSTSVVNKRNILHNRTKARYYNVYIYE